MPISNVFTNQYSIAVDV